MMEGRLPCRYTWSPGGSRSGNTPTRLTSRASQVGLQPQDSLHCPGWAAAPSVQRRHLGPSQPSLISCSPTGPLGSLQVEAPLLRRRYHQEGTSPHGMDLSQTELLQGSSEGTNVPSGTFHLFQCVGEGVHKGVLPRIQLHIFPPITTKKLINSLLEVTTSTREGGKRAQNWYSGEPRMRQGEVRL